MRDGESLALVLVEQDGHDTCDGLNIKDMHAIMPHSSAWNTENSTMELSFSTELPTESHKLCVIAVDASASTTGSPYAWHFFTCIGFPELPQQES